MFPILVYKCPGEHHAHDGATYKYKSASSQEELEKLCADDWHDSLVKAVEAFKAPEVEVKEPEIVVEEDQSQANKNAPPTREEMEVKAKELGIKFDGRTSDAKLLKLINASL